MQVDKGDKRRHTATVTLGAALKEARGSMTQAAIAAKIAPKGSVDQTRVSKWEGDKVKPDVDEIASFEKAAGKPPGFVLVRAGYVTARPTQQAIIADEDLSQMQREHLLNAYLVAVEMTKRGQ